MMLKRWIRGLALFRHQLLVDDLSLRLEHLRRIQQIRDSADDICMDGDVHLGAYEPHRLSLGRGVTIREGTVLSFGDQLNGFGEISVGSATWIGQYNNFRAGGGSIQVGENCLISQFCTLAASNHGTSRSEPMLQQPPAASPRGVILGDDVWLGAGVTVTAGACIGQGAVVGAGAVVTRNVPNYEIWAGIPARKVGERTQ